MNYCYIQNGGAERPGVAFLTCGLDCKLIIKNSIQRQHTAVTVARCNSTQRATLPAPAPAVAYAPKFDKPILTSRIVALNPVSFNSKYLADYGMLRWSMV